MHHLMLVTLEMPDGATSSDARFRAHDLLCEDPSFAGDGGRFGSPLCDWFVIGGRWSGLLTETLLGEAYKAAFEQRIPGDCQGLVHVRACSRRTATASTGSGGNSAERAPPGHPQRL